jgi:hypothetical protein
MAGFPRAVCGEEKELRLLFLRKEGRQREGRVEVAPRFRG